MAAHQERTVGGSASVTDLVNNFAAGCRLLTPVMDAALIPWRDEDQHDNWERVAEVLFVSLVAEPCEYAAVGEEQICMIKTEPYGFDIPPIGCNAHLAAVHGKTPPGRVVRLSSEKEPFDHVLVTGSGGTESIPLCEASFLFVFSSPNGETKIIEQIDLTL